MTQPVSEPTTARSIGYGQWRTNQLERRPAPAAESGAVVYAGIASQGEQTAQLNADNVYDMALFPANVGYSSDPSVLEPVSEDAALGGDSGIRVKTPGYLIATVRCLGWDNWTGAGNEVLNAVKGCAPAWAANYSGDYFGVSYGLSNFASAVAGTANEGDFNTTLTDSAIFTEDAANAYVGVAIIHSATVAAYIQDVELHVAWFAAYPAPDGVDYTWTP